MTLYACLLKQSWHVVSHTSVAAAMCSRHDLAHLGFVQGVVAVALHYMKGTPTEGQELTGTIIKGKKGTPRELRFTAKGAGQYEASLPTTDMLLGIHQ